MFGAPLHRGPTTSSTSAAITCRPRRRWSLRRTARRL